MVTIKFQLWKRVESACKCAQHKCPLHHHSWWPHQKYSHKRQSNTHDDHIKNTLTKDKAMQTEIIDATKKALLTYIAFW
jgi:hypothetical protein